MQFSAFLNLYLQTITLVCADWVNFKLTHSLYDAFSPNIMTDDVVCYFYNLVKIAYHSTIRISQIFTLIIHLF